MRYLSLIGFGICVAVVTIVQPVWAQVVQVTGIEVKRRTDGVEVRLETSGNARLYVSPSLTHHSFNSFAIDIPNAQLRLRDRETFQLDNPVIGVTLMTITPLNENSLRIEVRGVEQMPNVMLSQRDCVENTSCKHSFVVFLPGSATDE
ncbi:MAG TPA: AMIN domain-containing protein [Oculatellaceae cyanobacterium]